MCLLIVTKVQVKHNYSTAELQCMTTNSSCFRLELTKIALSFSILKESCCFFLVLVLVLVLGLVLFFLTLLTLVSHCSRDNTGNQGGNITSEGTQLLANGKNNLVRKLHLMNVLIV